MAVENQIVAQTSIEVALSSLLAIHSAVKNTALRTKLLSLREKLAGGQLHLAILGQMKRGKSSLANALLKADVLPTGILPVTAVITEIRYGKAPEATIVYSTGGARERVAIASLADYISEAANPGNTKQVAAVEIAYPSPFLQDGVVLIDTPGIGSTYSHNTETTRRYLEQVDAGILVLSVDPPITEAESKFIAEIKTDIPKLFFVLNKADLVSPDEAAEIFYFLERELERLGIASPEIFLLSARQSHNQGDGRSSAADPTRKGFGAFGQRLHTFLLEEKRQVLIRSVAADTLQIAQTLRFAAAIGARAATMTTRELQVRKQRLESLLDQAEMELRELHILMHQRSAEILEGVEQGLKVHTAASASEVANRLGLFYAQHPQATGRALGKLLENFLRGEMETVFRTWKVREDDHVQAQLDAFSSRFLSQANGILDRIVHEAGMLFDVPTERLQIDCPLRAESHLRYRVEPVFYSLDSFLLLLPKFLLRPLILRRVCKNLPQLLDMNAGRIRFDYLERLQASIGHFEDSLRAAVGLVTDSLKGELQTPSKDSPQQQSIVDPLDAVIRSCTCLL